MSTLPTTSSEFHAAVVIKRTGDDQRHLGVAYMDESKKKSVLHLNFHYMLGNEPLESSWLMFVPFFVPQRLFHLAVLCRQIWKSNGKDIPYAFSIPTGTSFNEDTGKMQLSPSQYGFTCSTFVMAAFEAARLPLLKSDTWPARESDAVFQNRIVEYLVRYKASEEHINAVKSEIGFVRFRPEEVAAAAEFKPPPASFADVEKRSLEIATMCDHKAAQPSQSQIAVDDEISAGRAQA